LLRLRSAFAGGHLRRIDDAGALTASVRIATYFARRVTVILVC
jgi:hypothetical protein